jgi:protein TonB
MRTFKFNSGNLDEITFEHRNKEYGAYELRKSYNSRLIKSFFSTLLLIAFIFGGTMGIQQLFKEKVLPVALPPDGKIFVTENIQVEKDKEVTPVHRPNPPQQNITTDAPFRVQKDSLLTETKNDTASGIIHQTIATANTGNDFATQATSDISTSGSGQGNENNNSIASVQPYSIAVVEKTPQFHGGEEALIKFLQDNIHYKESAKSAGINGRVYASFIVNSKGEIEAIKIIHGLGYGLDEEVIRVLNLMPKWEPGYYHGAAVSTIFNIPIAFNVLQ